MLVAPFTKEEIYSSITLLRKWKAPGPDGLPISFLLDNWNLVGHFVNDTIMGMLQVSIPIVHFNYIDIVFIPKGHTQNTLADYRPIGSCNALYKILSKSMRFY